MRSLLLDQAIALLHLKGSSVTKTELAAQLPSSSQCSVPMLLRACSLLGIRGRTASIDPDHLDSSLLPAIVMLKTGEYCILKSRALDHWDIQDSSGTTYQLDHDVFNQQYSGITIFLKPQNPIIEASLNKMRPFRNHWFWSVILSNRGTYRPVILNALMINLFAIAIPLFIMNVYDRVIPNDATETLVVMAIGVVSIVLFDFILKRLRQSLIDTAARRADILISSRIHNKALRIDSAYRPSSVGQFANNLRDFDSLRSFISSSTIVGLADLPFVLLFISIIALIGGSLAFIPLLLVPIVLGHGWWSQRKSQPIVEALYAMGAAKNAHTVESINNADTIKHLGIEGDRLGQHEALAAEYAHLNFHQRTLTTSISHVTVLTQQLATIAMVCWGVFLIMNLELTMGSLIACVMISSRISGPVSQIATLIAQYHQTKKAYTALDMLMKTPDDSITSDHAKSCIACTGEIELSNIDYAVNASTVILANVSAKFPAGSTTAIIGKIGAGKTSLLNVISTLYSANNGSVLYSGVDRRHQELSELRSKISVVDQYPRFFAGSIRSNIDPFGYCSDNELLELAEELGIGNLITGHPQGLAQPVSELGAGLSGGQKQSLALIRALSRQPKILILDEPTSGLDKSSEAAMLACLRSRTANITVIIATHKASMVELSDQVLVLDQGSVKFQGRPDELQTSSKIVEKQTHHDNS